MKYDLEERTARLAENIIVFVKTLKQDAVSKRIIEQLVGATGSIGANYCEANEAESKADFIHKIGIAKKEIKEAEHWIRLLAAAFPEHRERLRTFWQEAHEILLIFSKIKETARKKRVV